ncbi:hypothetical protein HOY80DRAFT_1040189 [Tuber brumale]|nr:hypothetical protein HOY80DRAFT_1040189 [Tuber brumale]
MNDNQLEPEDAAIIEAIAAQSVSVLSLLQNYLLQSMPPSIQAKHVSAHAAEAYTEEILASSHKQRTFERFHISLEIGLVGIQEEGDFMSLFVNS